MTAVAIENVGDELEQLRLESGLVLYYDLDKTTWVLQNYPAA